MSILCKQRRVRKLAIEMENEDREEIHNLEEHL
jgi:hypothetical protein